MYLFLYLKISDFRFASYAVEHVYWQHFKVCCNVTPLLRFCVFVSELNVKRCAASGKWVLVWRKFILTPRGRVFLEKLTVPQLVKEFPVFYGKKVHYRIHKSAALVSIGGSLELSFVMKSYLFLN